VLTLTKAYEHLHDLKRDLYMRLGRYFAEHYDVVMEDIHVKQLIGKSSRSLSRRLTDVSFSDNRSDEVSVRGIRKEAHSS